MRSCRLAFTVFALVCPGSTFGQADPVLKALCDRYWEALMEHNPTWATDIGDYRFNDKLEDVSNAGRLKFDEVLKGFLAEAKAIAADKLTEADQLTHDLLERALQDALKEHAALHKRFLPLEPLEGPHIRFPLFLVSHPFRNIEDFRTYTSRLRGFSKYVDDLIVNLRKGVSLGVTAPRMPIEKVVPQIRLHVVGDVAKSEFHKPVAAASTLSEADRKMVEQEVSDAIRTSVIPAYKKLLDYVEKEYLPTTRDAVGIGAVPGGDKMYAELAALSATVPVAAEDVHQLGLSEVARIREAMAKIQKEVSYPGTLDDFLAYMRSDPKFRFTSGEELYAAAGAILERAKSQMPKLFNRLPKADCVMKEIEAFRAPASPVAYYNPSPEDFSRPGYYYINLYKPGERLRFTLEALSYHEAVPGHHFQHAIAQDNKEIPKFRRYGGYTAYVEGWGLYTEKLGYEIGGYQDPYSRFGQLTFEMWRACRLVVDTGMHAKGWSRQKAIDFMVANTSLALVDIENEIDRYISWPGQALAYKTGEIRILNLRKEAEAELASKFDLKAFHDFLLSGGAMPIDVLEARVRKWVAGRAG